ncbi:MAG TPA: winged helix-turn-helix domain-containing protein, partial [Actinomycetes bacterium]
RGRRLPGLGRRRSPRAVAAPCRAGTGRSRSRHRWHGRERRRAARGGPGPAGRPGRGREIELTRREFDLLAHLVEHPHRVLTRRNLLDVVWQTMSSRGGGTRTVDVHVHRLRSKLGEPFARGLVTLRGVGYRWSPVG